MATLMENAQAIADGYNEYRDVIEGTATVINIPKGTTIISSYAFYNKQNFTSVFFPSSVTQIGGYAFYNTGLSGELIIGGNITDIGSQSFQFCENITKLIIENSVENLRYGCFNSCSGIVELTLPNSLTSIGTYAFQGCSSLRYVIIENGFNCNGLNLADSTLYSAETIVSWLNALTDRTGDTAYTLTIGSTNLAKLTAEQIAIATNKNWNLA